MKSWWARLKNTGLLRWMRAGMGLKWLVILVAVGFFVALNAAAALWLRISPEALQRFGPLVLVMLAGVLIFLVGIGALVAKLWMTRKKSGMTTARWKDEFFKREMLDKGPRIVAIGGGSGMSTLLRGLKMVTSNLTAVVTVADNGGNSGNINENRHS